jgi:hypothetical protein
MVRELEREEEKKRELINPIFDLDGTVIKEKIGLFKWTNPEAILGLRPEHLTELGVRIKNSGKQFDILTARGSDEKGFIKQALQSIGMNIRRVIAVGTKNKVLNKNRRTVRKKQWIVRVIQRKLVDNQYENVRELMMEGLGELYSN